MIATRKTPRLIRTEQMKLLSQSQLQESRMTWKLARTD